MMYTIEQIKQMSISSLNDAANDIRNEILRVTDINGGHLASNLGTVELTIALHRVFDSPKDKILFDVGHQAYTHKLLTGRSLDKMRSMDGVSGFPEPAESDHDAFAVGHSATAVSTALGMARARDVSGEDFHIIAVVGDGAFGGGMNMEAINDLGYKHTPLIILLNDNGMSISRNVGALSTHMVKLRTAKGYVGLKRGLERFLKRIPLVGGGLFNISLKTKNVFRRILMGNTFFDNMGIKFIGSVDGHDIEQLINIFNRAKDESVPVVVQIRTCKGKGMVSAENDPTKYHGVAPTSNNKDPQFTQVFGKELALLAHKNKSICAITAGMADSMGLTEFAKKYPERFFDVGIAEQHALGLAAGLAKGGLRPVVGIYSTFLQRGADQIFHDVALQKLPVVICIDRAGFVGQDGRTHQGAYDIAILRQQNVKIMAPANTYQLKQMLKMAFEEDTPCAIRYPKGTGIRQDLEKITNNKWQTVLDGSDATVITFGALLHQAIKAADILKGKGITLKVINACFINPIDVEMLKNIDTKLVMVLEDNAAPGGLGEAVAKYITNKKYIAISGEAGFAVHDSVKMQQKAAGLNAESLADKIEEALLLN